MGLGIPNDKTQKTRVHCARVFGVFIILIGTVFLSGVGIAETETPKYRLGTGDRLKITVFGHKDLSGTFEISGEGSISIPLIQTVMAKGLTLDQLEAAIIDKLRPDYLKKPNVSIEVLNYRPFYILGEVKKPGSYPFVNGVTIVKAIALAGGFTYRANKDEFLITRADDETRKKVSSSQNTIVLPGDIIQVKERFF